MLRPDVAMDSAVHQAAGPDGHEPDQRPHEEIDLMDAELTYGWVIGLAAVPLIELEKSPAEYPHIAPGADFNGCN
jgi:hypothetical protein